jgi:FAD-NAD(P)-binding
MDRAAETVAASVGIIGAGPRGVEMLERLAANFAGEDLGRPLTIHVIDPYPPGGGKVWRFDQSALLRLNSMAVDVTLFTDDTVVCEGPIDPGPTLAEWAATVPRDELPTDALRREADELVPITFPTRRLGGEYLAWAYRRAIGRLGPDVRVIEHRASATDIADLHTGLQQIVLDDGTDVVVDVVLMTLGHLDAVPTGEAAGLAEFAERNGLAYLPPAYGTEADLSVFGAGEDVIVRGFGLGFVDLLVLFTEGRGGRFVPAGTDPTAGPDPTSGQLRYEPSGHEPRLHIGSRRGVPYRTKITYELIGPKASHPRFLTREAISAMIEGRDVFEFRAHAWPIIAKEIAWAAYHELATAHPHRVSVPVAEIDRRLEAVGWGTPEWDATVAAIVPDPTDRVDFDALDRPLQGLRFDDQEALQSHLRASIRADIDRRADPHYSADLGAFNAFLAVFQQLPHILGSPKLSAKSRMQDFEDWWFGFFSYYASGPPPQRMEEMLALSEAGIISFLGAETWVRVDDQDGTFIAGSPSSPTTVSARALIDARLPGPAIQATRSPLVRNLAARGEVSELILRESDGSQIATGQMRVTPGDHHVIDANGLPHPRRFAIGANSTSKAPAFARPNVNALALRHNDACARAVLAALRGTS